MPKFTLYDIGKDYFVLRVGKKLISYIYYNTSNVVSYKNKEYFVETPYSSTEEEFNIYELTNKVMLPMKGLRKGRRKVKSIYGYC